MSLVTGTRRGRIPVPEIGPVDWTPAQVLSYARELVRAHRRTDRVRTWSLRPPFLTTATARCRTCGYEWPCLPAEWAERCLYAAGSPSTVWGSPKHKAPGTGWWPKLAVAAFTGTAAVVVLLFGWML